MSDVTIPVLGYSTDPRRVSAQVAFLNCLAFTIEQEGGLSDDLGDPGGITNLGATIYSWSDWLGRTATPADIRALTVDDVTPFYHARYWNALRAWNMLPSIGLMVFDHGVNAGVRDSGLILQRVAATAQTTYRVEIDGIVGPQTAGAVRAAGVRAMLDGLKAAQDADYRSKADANLFLKGWENRLRDRYNTAYRWAGLSVAVAPAT